MCMTDPGAYAMCDDASCTHFYCPTCIQLHLREILASGSAPVVCPGCHDDTAHATSSGRPGRAVRSLVTGQALTFLQKSGVIDLKLQFRIMKLQGELTTPFFECPNTPCGRLLVDSNVQVVHRTGTGGVTVHQVDVGLCECGARVCVGCHVVVSPASVEKHMCRQAQPSVAEAKAAYQLMEACMKSSAGQRCPKCQTYVDTRGGWALQPHHASSAATVL